MTRRSCVTDDSEGRRQFHSRISQASPEPTSLLETSARSTLNKPWRISPAGVRSTTTPSSWLAAPAPRSPLRAPRRFAGLRTSVVFGRFWTRSRPAGGGRLVFAVPSGIVWPLPLYELALLTARELEREGVSTELTIDTSEPSPLALLGTRASEAVAALLPERDIVRASTYVRAFVAGSFERSPPARSVPTTSSRFRDSRGPRSRAFQRTETDSCRRMNTAECPTQSACMRPGDLTSFPISRENRRAASRCRRGIDRRHRVRADRGEPFRPVQRVILLTGGRPTSMRVELGAGRGETSAVSDEALWWPTGKIVGRHLAPFLAGLGLADLRPDAEGRHPDTGDRSRHPPRARLADLTVALTA